MVHKLWAGLTHIHQVVVHPVHSGHFHEVILVVSLLGHFWPVGVVFEELIEELGDKDGAPRHFLPIFDGLKTHSGYCEWVELVSCEESLNGFCECRRESRPPPVWNRCPEAQKLTRFKVFLLPRKVPARWDLCAKTDATNLVLHLSFTGNRMSCYTTRAWWVPPGRGLTDLITETFDTDGTYPGTDREPSCWFHLSLSGTVGRWFRPSR